MTPGTKSNSTRKALLKAWKRRRRRLLAILFWTAWAALRLWRLTFTTDEKQ